MQGRSAWPSHPWDDAGEDSHRPSPTLPPLVSLSLALPAHLGLTRRVCAAAAFPLAAAALAARELLPPFCCTNAPPPRSWRCLAIAPDSHLVRQRSLRRTYDDAGKARLALACILQCRSEDCGLSCFFSMALLRTRVQHGALVLCWQAVSCCPIFFNAPPPHLVALSCA